MSHDVFTLALQHGSAYQLHHFVSKAHAHAWIAINKIKNARPMSQVHGGRMRPDIDHTGEYDARVEEKIMADEFVPELVAAAPATPPPTGQRVYACGRIVRALSIGERVGILHATAVVPAVIRTLAQDYIEIEIDNRAYGRNPIRRIDVTTTGVGLTLDKIVAYPQQVTA